MSDLPLEIGTMAWAIESPFNTLEIICHAANIPQESRPLVKTTKLVLPDLHPTFCHPKCYNACSINYIVLSLDQLDKVIDWAEHHGLHKNLGDIYWCRIDGVQRSVHLLELVNTKKSRSKPEKILRGIYKEMEEERAGKRRWNRKKSFRLAQIIRRKKRAKWSSWTEFLLSRMTIAEYYLWRLRLKLRRLLYYLQRLLQSELGPVLDMILRMMGLEKSQEHDL